MRCSHCGMPGNACVCNGSEWLQDPSRREDEEQDCKPDPASRLVLSMGANCLVGPKESGPAPKDDQKFLASWENNEPVIANWSESHGGWLVCGRWLWKGQPDWWAKINWKAIER